MVSTKSVKSYVDSSESYMAVSIQTPNRSEVQVLDLSTRQVITRFELDSEDLISVIQWTVQRVGLKGSNKRNADGSLSEDKNAVSVHLIVTLEQGDVLVFSPLQKDIVNKISNESKVISLFPLLQESGKEVFFGLDKSGQIKEFALLQNEVISTYLFEDDIAISKIMPVIGDDHKILMVSSSLYVGTIGQGRNIETAFRIPVPRGHGSPINSCVQSSQHPSLFVTSRVDDDIIHVHLRKIFNGLLQASSPVSSLQIVEMSGKELLIAYLLNGKVEIFQDWQLKRVKDDKLLAAVKVESTLDIDSIFVDRQHNFLKCVLFDDIEPQFHDINLSRAENVIKPKQLKTNGANENVQPVDSEDEDMVIDQVSESDNQTNIDNDYVVSSADQLYSLLDFAINTQNDEELMLICQSNNSDLNIKQTILKNVTAEQSVIIFTKLSVKISGQPSNSTNLSKWLKYLLLIHGNNIIRSSDNVAILKLLRSSLLESTKNLPNLVALQGRLQLLKSQLQLRNEMANLSIEESDDDESESDDDEDDEDETHTNGNGGSFYVNGEGNDDIVYDDKDVIDPEDEDEE